MTIVDDIVTLLEADNGVGGVATLLTGGIYTYNETGRLGISRKGTPGAYNTTTGIMKPCCVVKARGQNHDNGIWDDPAQSVSYRQVIELWFYDDGSAGFTAITSARNRAFTVIHGKMIGSSKLIARWAGHPIEDARDQELDYAAMMRADYDVRGLV
jgi:hypothetical protein